MTKIKNPALLSIAGLMLMMFVHADKAGAQIDRNLPPPDAQDLESATRMMSLHHMQMGPHMKMTALRPAQPGDRERAQRVVDDARKAMAKYRDYHVALNDGYRIFLPNVPQQQYHFTNYSNGFDAAFEFDPAKPTSLLYDKTADGYKLAGVMYTASRSATEDDLNARIPLSVARWHEHVNFCFPPKGREAEMWRRSAKFGLAGSITTRQECDQAGGRFVPLLFGWMVHVYPDEKDVWGTAEHEHHDMKHMD
jgi:hypothetical protein